MGRSIARRTLALLFALALAAAFGWTTAQLMDRAQADRESVADRARLHDQITDVETANAALAEQVRELGAVPIAETDGSMAPLVVPMQGPRGIPGVTGPAGRPGADGKAGRPGAPGTDGGPGATGPTGKDGATGPAGKDGANGRDGTNGKDGAPGRGIASIACADSGDWLIAFTDGTTQSVSGPCRVMSTAPDPAPAD